MTNNIYLDVLRNRVGILEDRLRYVSGECLPPAAMFAIGELMMTEEEGEELLRILEELINKALQKLDPNDPWTMWKKYHSWEPQEGYWYELEMFGSRRVSGCYDNGEWQLRVRKAE